MQTECNADLFGFAPVEGHKVVAAFDGGTMTSEAGAMLLGATDRQIGLIERFAGCFTDYRVADLVEHTVPSLVGQRVFGIALGGACPRAGDAGPGGVPMQTECTDLFGFTPVEGRKVVAAFDGGQMTSDAGAMLLGATDKQIRLIERFADCFTDYRVADLVEHTVPSLVGQRVFGIALGYEDLIDHDQLRHDPVLAVLGGKLAAKRADCAPLAGKSTLNRLELSREEPTRYYKISYDAGAIEGLFVDLFLDTHSAPPPQITLDLDATDDPLHGQQEGRFFHGYYDAYCYLPLYVCSAVGIYWRPNCAQPISTAAPAASRRWRGSLPRSASAGPRCAFCCAAIRALPARR